MEANLRNIQKIKPLQQGWILDNLIKKIHLRRSHITLNSE
jgi:retron-type reverse transcriptase